MSDAFAKVLEQYKDARVPGGCDSCDAYQTVEQLAPKTWAVHVHHDEGCPVLAKHEARKS